MAAGTHLANTLHRVGRLQESACAWQILLLVSAGFLSACSASSSGVVVEPVHEPAPRVVITDLVPADRQLLAELAEIKTSFIVPSNAAAEAERRARLFIDQYLADTSFAASRGAGISVQGKSSGGSFLYEVRRETLAKGTRYAVSCKALKGDAPAAALRAKNLSRFIQTGLLDAALVSDSRNLR